MQTTFHQTPFHEASRKILATVLVVFPALFGLVFLLHFRRWSDLLTFRVHYVPAPPERIIVSLIAAHNSWPLIHDPHMIAYLTLPLIPLCSFALYLVGRDRRPIASALTMTTTITGVIYLGGVFGMWTAFFRGIGNVDPSQVTGATATFAALTAPQGAFLVTTTLAKLTMIGLAAQTVVLLGTRTIPLWSVLSVVAGCFLFLAFWDLDNWMLIGSILILSGLLPVRRAILRTTDQNT